MEQAAFDQKLAQQANEHHALQPIPIAQQSYHEPESHHSIGSMVAKCPKCKAVHFIGERLTRSSWNNPKFDICCLDGQVVLEAFKEPPPALKQLFTEASPTARKFREHICQYNAAFAFTSTSANIDFPCFKALEYTASIYMVLCIIV
jgi:hypothetical protein